MPAGEPQLGRRGTSRLRRFVRRQNAGHDRRPTSATGKDLIPAPARRAPLTFIGVDAQYFSAVLMPQRPIRPTSGSTNCIPSAWARSIRSTRTSPTHRAGWSARWRELKPGQTMTNRFRLFAGPKKAAILENNEYRLGELVYYGWPFRGGRRAADDDPALVSTRWCGNYGLAIILLDRVGARLHVPLSRKQAIGAQKMQELQPEIKKIQEKYKNNTEGRTKAQQELFRKHNYNPLSGCLPIFIQMPVFIGPVPLADGRHRAARRAVACRTPIRWCSNLAAPDMLYDWSWFMPDLVNSGIGMFGLGPYFNLLPMLTIVLFIVQQKMFMPPPADEQAAMQQKMMKYMMIFMGMMFFKVASGLCIYFIASSLWGLGERKFLPEDHDRPPAASTR